jgi:hypothetical protein
MRSGSVAKKKKPPKSLTYNPAKQKATPVYRNGSVIFDTQTRKYITPGQWREGEVATNIRFWDFEKAELAARNRQRIVLEYKYDKNRKRI